MFHPNFGGDAKRTLEAIGRTLAIAEFDPAGKIIAANSKFCALFGYDFAEIKGRPHSLFVEPEVVKSPAYKEFWSKLGRGEADAREYKRISKEGKTIWLQASYSPVVSRSGTVLKVVTVATDITAAKLTATEGAGRLAGISRVQVIVEYSLDAKIVDVNENFVKKTGVAREKAVGMEHRQLVDPAYAQSSEYQEFWARLRRGEHIAETVKRVGEGGKELWIEASYNPIYDLDGRVAKIVNFVNDVTDRVGAVNRIAAGLSRLAEGDLEQRIDVTFIPTLDQLRVDFNKSLETLEESMVAISANAQTLRAGVGEITTAADDLSRRTEQQASSLQETAAALEQITSTVRRTAEGAKHARDVVSTAKVDADKSGQVVRGAMDAMAGIEKSSKQISQIIGVIDEIAFQTNLLALNAGVEAARAGEAGRGFAVVASEVRALAQRSAEAAKEIKGLISASTAQVDQGVTLVRQTGDALDRIVAQVVEINSVITDIAASAHEQASGLQEVNATVGEMDKVTQQNAAMVEQTTAASHALSQGTEELAQLIDRFSIRRPADEPIRAQLKKAAPHAFREAPKRAPAGAGPALVRRTAPRVVAAAPRAAGGGADGDWREF